MRSDQAGRPSPAVPRPIYPLEAISGIRGRARDSAARHLPDDVQPRSDLGQDWQRRRPGPVPSPDVRVPDREHARASRSFAGCSTNARTASASTCPRRRARTGCGRPRRCSSAIRIRGGATAVTSRIRPDIRAVRRNAYYRLFGIDLNHGLRRRASVPVRRSRQIANKEFVSLFEEFLREVWRGIENFSNTSGANADRRRRDRRARRIARRHPDGAPPRTARSRVRSSLPWRRCRGSTSR